ncbi:hypothetical protein ASJ81_00900 [Methanosarcina spelaei]|uniref:Uncharacterized protein n=1 Tax=Methanosarcina spelaei TaxID=1036679 RepID=A0A2A2HVB4_9EURY|nr:hypothetical protein ASJ81_00900 [Methanosarcina spelaei]
MKNSIIGPSYNTQFINLLIFINWFSSLFYKTILSTNFSLFYKAVLSTNFSLFYKEDPGITFSELIPAIDNILRFFVCFIFSV